MIAEFSAFIEELPELVRWRQGRCVPYGEGVTFWAFGEIVKAQAGVLDSDVPEKASAKLEASLAAVGEDTPQREWLLARLAPLLGAGSESDIPRAELFAAWRRFVEALAAEGRLVMVIEDLHWADATMLEFIDDLVESSTVPFLLVCAARPELLERFPDWGSEHRNATRIDLPPLSDAETAQLLSALLDRAVLPAETQATLLERSGGNPLYAEEFVQMLVDHGILDRSGRMVATSDDISVPESLRGLIASRLDALPAKDKALLQDASVIGKVFWSGAVSVLSGVDEDDVRKRLGDAARRELVKPQRTSALTGQTEYVFWHALIRDVAYAQIPRAVRARKHIDAGRWLRVAVAERIADFAEELAYHYAEALELTQALGRRDHLADLRAETASALVLAGERASPLDAMRADAYFRRALALMDAHHPDLARASSRAAEMAEARGDFDESEQLFVAAIAAYRTTGNVLGLGEALGLLSRSLGRRGKRERAEQLMDEALEVLEAQPPSRELARIYSRKAGELLGSDDYRGTLAWSEKAIGLAEQLGLPDESARALQFRGAARCELGDDEGGLADIREAIDRAVRSGLGQTAALAHGNYAYQLWFREGPGSALEVWREMYRIASARGFVTQAQQARMGELEALFDLGDWDRVLEIAREVAAWSQPRGGRSEIAIYCQIFEAWVRLRRGESAQVAMLAEDLVESARHYGYSEYVAPALLVAAETRRANGDWSGALEALRLFAEATESAPNYRALFVPVAARALLGLGKVDEAEALIPADAEVRTPRHRMSVLTARALISEARGNQEDALGTYREATELWFAHGFRLERSLTLIGAGAVPARARPARGGVGLARGGASRASAPGRAAGAPGNRRALERAGRRDLVKGPVT